MFQRIEAVPAYRIVCDAIEKQIMSGRLGAGDQLPIETELAEQFGLARHTVREGLRLLEESGLVGREAGRRLVVKEPHYAELAPRASRALIMQRVTFEELWEVSMSLEPSAAARAASRIDDDQIAALEDNLRQMEEELAAGRSIIALDVAFHTLVAEIAGNKALLLAREPISQLFYPALEKLFAHPLNCVTGPRRLADAHRHIIDALKHHDRDAAELWMRRHMVDFRRGYELCSFDLREAIAFEGA
ncbi:FadR/GntR family transcriptional regulator [Aquabacter spiritensis]|uniref:GntR family transcriptional regulator n=1 Tax=Aquabacter spiritensis TaxID=933073 RepID=A0A4R3LQX4_9HYPH|nr:FCD domain-containing protein [Aquabacter spiritensis]TCT00487.1 GntR family transcriptional regulator [Aquabacter spiritensis]